MDDDIESIHRLRGSETEETDPLAVADDGFRRLEQTSLRLWGIYPTLNPFWMAEEAQVGLYFCIGCFYGEIVAQDEFLNSRFGDQKGDYERCLRHYELFGGVVRMNYYAPKTRYGGNPAGDELASAQRRAEENVLQLENRWPDLVRRNPRRKGTNPEILLNTKKRGNR